MYLVKSIEISNYKSCKSTKCDFSAFSPIVGCNNVGKTTIISALDWCLTGNSLDESFFNDTDRPVSVSLEIIGVTKDILNNLDSKHRASIEPYVNNDVLKIKREQSAPNAGKKGMSFLVWDWSKSEWVANPLGISNATKPILPEVIYIEAMQNVAEDVAKYKTSTTIGKLIAHISEQAVAKHTKELEPHLEAIENILGADGAKRSNYLTDIDAGVSDKLQDFFPGLKVKVYMPTPKIKEIFKTATIKTHEHGQAEERDILSIGHGAQRSIQMALVRHLAEIKSSNTNEPTKLLLIDEPELYLHPQAIEHLRESLEVLSSQGYQIIFSTHSAHMIGKNNVSRTSIVRKSIGTTHALPKIESVVNQVIQDAEHQADLLFSISNASQILFADNILLVEGKTEMAILPELTKHITGKSLSELNTVMIGVGGTGSLKGAKQVLDGIGIKSYAIVDLDYALQHGAKAGFIDAAHPDLLKLKTFMLSLTAQGLDINELGVPKKWCRGNAYSNLSKNLEILACCEKIAEELKKYGIWLWTKGTIESHLGIDSKNPAAWRKYLDAVRKNGLEKETHDHMAIQGLMDWLIKTTLPISKTKKSQKSALEETFKQNGEEVNSDLSESTTKASSTKPVQPTILHSEKENLAKKLPH